MAGMVWIWAFVVVLAGRTFVDLGWGFGLAYAVVVLVYMIDLSRVVWARRAQYGRALYWWIWLCYGVLVGLVTAGRLGLV